LRLLGLKYWLVAQNITAAPDGYQRQILAFNGTVPGPTIEANWGDNVIIHVTNQIANNGCADIFNFFLQKKLTNHIVQNSSPLAWNSTVKCQ
jgi:FtsP/CotA-like multicopper oxidase with cupredoxin domain